MHLLYTKSPDVWQNVFQLKALSSLALAQPLFL